MKLTIVRDGLVIATCAVALGLAGLYGFEKYQAIQTDRAKHAETDVKAMSAAMPSNLMQECGSQSSNGYGGTDWLAMRSCVKEMIDSGEAGRVTLENERIYAEELEKIRKRDEADKANCGTEAATADGGIDQQKYAECLLRKLAQ